MPMNDVFSVEAIPVKHLFWQMFTVCLQRGQLNFKEQLIENGCYSFTDTKWLESSGTPAVNSVQLHFCQWDNFAV